MTFTLAWDVINKVPDKKGLSLYFLKIRNDNGELNNIEVVWMKDKLGTKQLPTAELLLKGSVAYWIGTPNKGISQIGTILNISWFHNAINSVASIWRILALARDYSDWRSVFNWKLNESPLHI